MTGEPGTVTPAELLRRLPDNALVGLALDEETSLAVILAVSNEAIRRSQLRRDG